MKITRKCNRCKKWFAMQMREKTFVRKDEIRIFESLMKPNPKGGVETALDRFAPVKDFIMMYFMFVNIAEQKKKNLHLKMSRNDELTLIIQRNE